MYFKVARMFAIILIAGLFLSLGLPSSHAQQYQNPVPAQAGPADPPPPVKDGEELLFSDARPGEPQEPIVLLAGAETAFGYTWRDTADGATFDWESAENGNDAGITNSNVVAGPVDIGFEFPYFENKYSQLYISRHGYVSFGGYDGFDPAQLSDAQSVIPSAEPPNNVITPYWAAFNNILPGGYVKYLQGGTEPNRFFVVEWNNMAANEQWLEPYTFELILYENGDMKFQYADMPDSGSFYYPSSGIENSTGLEGLAITKFGERITADNHVVEITRPADQARVWVDRPYQSLFTQAGKELVYEFTLGNTGTLDATYTLNSPISPTSWRVDFYRSDGGTLTELVDTNGDSLLEIGSIEPKNSVKIVAKVQTPDGAVVGDHNTVDAEICPSIEPPGPCKTVHLMAAVPAPFSQVVIDSGRLYQSNHWPQGVKTNTVNSNDGLSTPAVAELPDGNFINVWAAKRCLNTGCGLYAHEIYYAIVTRFGYPVRSATRLTNHTGASTPTLDDFPVVAAGRDGSIGLAWLRRSGPENNYKYDVFFAVLNAQGSLVHGPRNLTNSPSSAPNGLPVYNWLSISPAGGDAYMLAWSRSERAPNCSSGDCSYDDIYTTVITSGGVQRQAILEYLQDNLSADAGGYFFPNLAPTEDGGVLLTWTQVAGNASNIYLARFNSNGGKVWPDAANGRQMSVSSGGFPINFRSAAAQFGGGKIILAWTKTDSTGDRTAFVVLDPDNDYSYHSIEEFDYPNIAPDDTAPETTPLASAKTISVVPAGQYAVLTWLDYTWDYRGSLTYALVGPEYDPEKGSVVTPPVNFYTNRFEKYTPLGNVTSFAATTLSSTLPAGVDAAVWTNLLTLETRPNEQVAFNVYFASLAQDPARNVTLTAQLPAGFSFHSGTFGGVTPVVIGSQVKWNLPDLGFQEYGSFTLRLNVNGNVRGGKHQVNLSIAADEDNQSFNNTALVEITVRRELFLPFINR